MIIAQNTRFDNSSFRSGEELETTLHRYVWLYNQQLPQSALGSKTPLQAMKDCHKLKPKLFNNSHTTVRDVTLLDPRFVLFQNLIDDRNERTQLRTGWCLAPPISRRHRVL